MPDAPWALPQDKLSDPARIDAARRQEEAEDTARERELQAASDPAGATIERGTGDDAAAARLRSEVVEEMAAAGVDVESDAEGSGSAKAPDLSSMFLERPSAGVCRRIEDHILWRYRDAAVAKLPLHTDYTEWRNAVYRFIVLNYMISEVQNSVPVGARSLSEMCQREVSNYRVTEQLSLPFELEFFIAAFEHVKGIFDSDGQSDPS